MPTDRWQRLEQVFAEAMAQPAGVRAPRVRMLTLMLSGRYDFGAPLETSQRPLFALFGSPAGRKRHVIFETGHALPIDDVAREILPWLDRYLGPVARSAGARRKD